MPGKTMASHGRIGYGLMGLTPQHGGVPEEQAIEAMRAAIENGCTVWNGGIFYGPPENNSLVLLRKYFEKYPEDAAKVQLNIKGCIDVAKRAPAGSREAVLKDVQKAIEQLPPEVKKIDIFEPARIDRTVTLEETMNALKECQENGWIGGVGLSEASAATIRKANSIVRIQAVETEVGMFTPDAFTNGVAQTCAELDIPIQAYGTLGKGVLTGQLKSLDQIPDGDHRKSFPRFKPEAFQSNLELVNGLNALAQKKGCTTGQIAIGWVVALSETPGMPKIIPIPGASKAERVRENAKLVELTPQDMDEIKSLLAQFKTKGERYPPGLIDHLNG